MTTIYRIKLWSETFENHKTREKPGMAMKRLQAPIDFQGIGYNLLVIMDDGEAFYGCWSVTTMVAAQCSPRGALIRKDGSPHTPETVAAITRFRPEVMARAWEAFKKIGWLLPAEGDFNPPASTPRPSTAPSAPHPRPSGATQSSLDRPGRVGGAPILDPELDPEMDPPLSPPLGGAGCGNSGEPDRIGFRLPSQALKEAPARPRRPRKPRWPRTPPAIEAGATACDQCEGGRIYIGAGFSRRIERTCECPAGRDLAAALNADRRATQRAVFAQRAREAQRPPFLRRRGTGALRGIGDVIPEILTELEPDSE